MSLQLTLPAFCFLGETALFINTETNMSFNPAGFGGYLLFMTHQSTAAVAHCFMMHLMKSIHHIHAKAGVGYMFWGLVIWTKSGEHYKTVKRK